MSDKGLAAAEKRAVAKAPAKKNLMSIIQSDVMQKQIAMALPSVITPERFTRIALSAISTNPKLAECTPESFLGAMMTAAQMGVEPNTPLGQAYLIPYGNKVQFQLGYKGLLDLAYRSGEVVNACAYTVYSNDVFEYELGLEPKLKHIPATRDRGEPIYFYATFRTKSGGYGFEVMSIDDVRNHRKRYSKAMNSPWDTNFEEMAKKTVLKRVLRYAPMKTDFVRGISVDETVHNTISDDMTLEPIEVDLTDPDVMGEDVT